MKPPPTSLPPPPVLLYDGLCALCNRSVRWLIRHDRRRHVRFAALAGETAAAILARHPELAGADTVVFVEAAGSPAERVLVLSAAALAALRQGGLFWRFLAGVATLVPRPIRDAAYRFVARRRYRRFGRYETCPLPPPAERERFLP